MSLMVTATAEHNYLYPDASTLHLLVKNMAGTVGFRFVRIETLEGCEYDSRAAYFFKTVEDLYEAVAGSVPNAKFGLAICEASGDCLIMIEEIDQGLKVLARENSAIIGAGHSFILFLQDCFPINGLNAIKNI